MLVVSKYSVSSTPEELATLLRNRRMSLRATSASNIKRLYELLLCDFNHLFMVWNHVVCGISNW